ncbi:MAG: YciI family protein [Rhizobiaceae bacterium]|nr:YciI family protein [Rhizobiaceae bacterium]
MLYAILAYHVEGAITALSPEEDAALMEHLIGINQRLTRDGKLGPAARLDFTGKATTLRGSAASPVLDGPFAETKEQLLGLYVLNCETHDEAVAIAREFKSVNPTAVYEIRPIVYYDPGAASLIAKEAAE